MAPIADNHEKIKKEILDRAAELFLTQGYKKTSIRQIAEAAGMLKGNLYYYFKKKEDILLFLFRDSVESLYKQIVAAIDHTDPLMRYAVMTRTYLHILDKHRPLLNIYIEASEVQALRLAFFDILNQVFNTLFQESALSFTKDQLYISTLASASVETEMLSHFERGDIDIETVITTVIRVKLSLLNLEPKTIANVIEASRDMDVHID
ncbi:hypothetical protein GCM10011391_12070 [Pullulanibacillus camelliae]|uniref:HTH tetR-type domain-containing protein n=1 Tax=Pullulanibacillus camelliae TaxID=1707096 RepID=A0A8J2VNJ8_9BACL|nr:TetR/AcrR family transcriptional regulator [Pullulanibacillus camelliae]GGE34980.1 hypothetical protein GCM10011391_12070 [Pullulanibacillus camelliae]